MASELFLDPGSIDLSKVVADVAAIEKLNPQRGDMRHLDGIVYLNPEQTLIVGYKDVKPDEFWVSGHIPGRPLFPGVLMIEAAAQLCTFLMKTRFQGLGFIGFIGCDEVKFRSQVVPGQKLILMGREAQLKPRRCIMDVQGVVEGKLVFEARITGMPI